MIDLKALQKATDNYNHVLSSSIDKNTNRRLVKLVDKYGIEAVVIATGLKASSIVLYTSRNTAPQIKEATISKAESILSSF
ncbi:MAG: hypothetical protein GY928_01085 [Colwellia sp.]|nr:hypothetical protein [Colwellia sp.]